MKKLLDFNDFLSLDENERFEEDSQLDEAIDVKSLRKKHSSKEDFKTALLAKIKKNSPSLADDEDFMEQLEKSFEK